jgi:WD40 repeat protein
MSKNVEVDQRVASARLPTNLFGRRVGGIAVDNGFFMTAVDDGTIWIWNMETMEVERKLLAESDAATWVRPLQIIQVFDKKRNRGRTKLVSGWADGAIRVYDTRTWQLEHTLVAHNGPVLCLDASDGRLLRCSYVCMPDFLYVRKNFLCIFLLV